jgi:hypothetical protein
VVTEQGMFFEVEHILDGALEAIEAAMFHPDYLNYLVSNHEILTGTRSQNIEERGDQITRRVHYVARPAFDHVGFKEVPPSWFEFVESSTFDKRTHVMSFHNVPVVEKVAERMLNRGEIILEPLPSGKTRRRTKAEIKLRNLPLLARPMAPMVEQMIAREAKRLLEIEARVLNAWLEQAQANPGRASVTA